MTDRVVYDGNKVIVLTLSSTDVEKLTHRLVYDGNSDIVLTLSSTDVEKMTNRLVCDGIRVILFSLLAQLTLRNDRQTGVRWEQSDCSHS